jgi:hypothetical protein
MKKVAFVALFAVVIVGLCFAQGTKTVKKVDGVRSLTITADGQRVDTPQRAGSMIWNNMGTSNFFTWQYPNYMYVDNGFLNNVDTNGLPDEVIDGLTFSYGTGDLNPAGLDWAVFWYDHASGWGDATVVQQTGLLFTGLPNAANLPPGYWGWFITVDLEAAGTSINHYFEFLLDEGDLSNPATNADGISEGLLLASNTATTIYNGPLIGTPPSKAGNSGTQNQDVFEIFYPNGAYKGAYWFGGYPGNPWASWVMALYGSQDPAANTQYVGIGLQGNDTNMYTTGSWTQGSNVHFMLRSNQMTQQHWLLASLSTQVKYYAFPDLTLIIKKPLSAWRRLMSPITPKISDHEMYDFINLGKGLAGKTAYLQGVISNYFTGGGAKPSDAANGVQTN